MIAEKERIYIIELKLKSGATVQSIEFKNYPPEQAIIAGYRLYDAVSHEVIEIEDLFEN